MFKKFRFQLIIGAVICMIACAVFITAINNGHHNDDRQIDWMKEDLRQLEFHLEELENDKKQMDDPIHIMELDDLISDYKKDIERAMLELAAAELDVIERRKAILPQIILILAIIVASSFGAVFLLFFIIKKLSRIRNTVHLLLIPVFLFLILSLIFLAEKTSVYSIVMALLFCGSTGFYGLMIIAEKISGGKDR